MPPAALAFISLEHLQAQYVIARRCLYIRNDSADHLIDEIEKDKDLQYEPHYTALFQGNRFLKVFHAKWVHLACAIINFGLILGFWFGGQDVPMIIRNGAFLCLSVAVISNLMWSIAGCLEKTEQLFSSMMRYLPVLLGKGMLIFLDMIVAPIAKMTLQLWTTTSTQECGSDRYLQISRVTSGWYDFIFKHEGICANCTIPTNSSLCAEFCGPTTVSFLKIDPTLRYGRDVRTTQGFTFYGTVTFLLGLLPGGYSTFISITTSALMFVPVYGKTVAQKWTNLVSRVSSPMIGLVAPYRDNHSYWMLLKHFLKTILMFTSGVQVSDDDHGRLTTFAITFGVLDGLYLLILFCFVNPFVSFANYLYELLITTVTIGFTMRYLHLVEAGQIQQSNFYSQWAAPAVLLFVVISIAIFWGVDSLIQREHIDESRFGSRKRQRVNHCEWLDFFFKGTCRYDAAHASPVTIHAIDLNDIEQISGNENPPVGNEIIVNSERLRIHTNGIMQAVSTSYTELDVNRLLKILIFLGVMNFGAFGWYFGSVYGIHLERLSVNC
jgi:hypothetical protein